MSYGPRRNQIDKVVVENLGQAFFHS
jgi:hypothetical protein